MGAIKDKIQIEMKAFNVLIDFISGQLKTRLYTALQFAICCTIPSVLHAVYMSLII